MFPFNRFPYTDFEKINLDWLMRKIKDAISGVVTSVNGQTGDVNITADDVHALPDTYTPPVVDVNGQTGNVNLSAQDIPGSMFIPSESDIGSFRYKILHHALDYIYRMVDTDCVSGRSETLTPPDTYKPKYDTSGKNWQSLLQKDGIYTNDFECDWDGSSLTIPTVYFNCSGYVGLCIADRDYRDSVYYYYLDNYGNLPTLAQLQNKAAEKGTWDEAPYTFDWLRRFHTFESIKVMRDSGNTPQIVYQYHSGAGGVYDETYFDKLETGDILYHARLDTQSPNTWPDHVHHVLIFVKKWAHIEELGEEFHCRFQPMQFYDALANGYYTIPHELGDDPDDYYDRGYVLHCSWGTDELGNQSDSQRNVIRIECLDHYLATQDGHSHEPEWCILYACKPYSNFLNSSKAQRVLSGITYAQDDLRFGSRDGTTIPASNKFVPSDYDSHARWYMSYAEVAGELGVGVASRDPDTGVPVYRVKANGGNGNIETKGKITADGNVESGGTLKALGNLDILGSGSIGGTLNVIDKTTLANDLDVAGLVTADAVKTGQFTMTAKALTTGDDIFTVPGGFYYWTSANYPNIANLPTPAGTNVYGSAIKFDAGSSRYIILVSFGNATSHDLFIGFKNGSSPTFSGWITLGS